MSIAHARPIRVRRAHAPKRDPALVTALGAFFAAAVLLCFSFPDEASAMRFARTQTGPCGCAVMLVPEGLDVDLVPRAV
jgi:hypothetical protein